MEEVVTHEVAHGPRSRIIDQAENPLWTQMVLVLWMIEGSPAKA